KAAEYATDRPWISGYTVDQYNAGHKTALQFDYEKGWDRPDYINANKQGEGIILDPEAYKGAEPANYEMYIGDGNTVTNFTISRHEGEGIDLALKAKERYDDRVPYEVTKNGDVYVYEAEAAVFSPPPSWGPAAMWQFDFSVATGLNGAESTLD